MQIKKISIVGAGLVGSLWAVLLKKRGHDVTLFEKRGDIRSLASTEDRSINLVITSRGLNALNMAGLLEEAINLSVPILGRMIHSRVGETQFQSYGSSNECNFSISRSALNKFLLNAAEKAGVKIHFGHEIDSVDFNKRTLSFKNVRDISSYDILFGTDGAGSLVRKNLCHQFPHEFSEFTDWLEADYKELFMPASAGARYQIEKNALHIWPRGSHMMMALANLDGSFTVTLYMPRSNFAENTTKENIENLFKEDFSDAIALMPDYVSDFLTHPEGKLGTVRCSKWTYKDSVVLMGDAAHAILPFFGQGMNCGFEDCINFLKILDQTDGNWSEAIPQFEKIQKPNADAIAEMAIENWTEMRDKVGDAKFLLRKKVEAFLEKEFPQIFKSRYGMVTYTMIPYATAKEVGLIHDRILNSICTSIERVEDVSLTEVSALLKEKLEPYVKSHNLNLGTDPLVAKMRQHYNT
ncbi:MAG: NAD(P)/FAD-dependent oxidoreductase [Bacteriovorax sp.]